MTQILKTKEIKILTLVLALLSTLWAIDTTQNNTITGYQTAEEIDYSIPGFVLEKGWNLIGISNDMRGFKTVNDFKGNCKIGYAFAYDDNSQLHLMNVPNKAAKIDDYTMEGNAMWVYTNNKCRFNPKAEEETFSISGRQPPKLNEGQTSTRLITKQMIGRKLGDFIIRGCNIEKAWVYIPSGTKESTEEAEGYVSWIRLLPNDMIGEGYLGRGMVIKAGQCTATLPPYFNILETRKKILSVKSELPLIDTLPSEGGWQMFLYAATEKERPLGNDANIGHIFSNSNQLDFSSEERAGMSNILNSASYYSNAKWYDQRVREYTYSDIPLLLRMNTGTPLEQSTLTLQLESGKEFPIYLPAFTPNAPPYYEIYLLVGADGSTYWIDEVERTMDYHIEIARKAPTAATQ